MVALSIVLLGLIRSERLSPKVGLRLARAIQAGTHLGGEVSGTLAVIGTPGRTRPAIDGRNMGRAVRLPGTEEGDAESTTTEEISNVVVESLWQRVEPRPSVPELLEVEQCSNEECPIRHLQFQTTQLLFEVHLDLEGGRTKAICLDGSERKDEALGRVNNKTPSTLRCVQAPKKND